MMKKVLACILIITMLWIPTLACADDAEAGWDFSVSAEITEEVQAMFDEAVAQLVGVAYTPVAVLGVRDSTWCILCRAKAVYPDAKPYNTLVYIDAEKMEIQNIYELWIDKHSGRDNSEPVDGTSNCA